MQRLNWILALATLLPPAAGAVSVEPHCDPWHDDRSLLAMGGFTLGTPTATIDAALERLPDCVLAADARPIDCEYHDEDGIAYLVDAHGLVRVEARVGEARSTALPLGLEFGETPEEVARRLNAMLPVESPVRQLLAQVDARAWATGACVVHGGAEGSSFYVEFDNDRGLSRVGLGWHAN